MRELRVSPDGDKVAIRGDAADENAPNAYGVFDAVNGGHWAALSDPVDDISEWQVLDYPASAPAPAAERAPKKTKS